MSPAARVVVCAKSTWYPALRREHALSAAVAACGVEVDFIEQPTDIRRLRREPRWLTATPEPAGGSSRPVPGVLVTSRRTVAPGHRHALAHMIDNRGLRRTLARKARSGSRVDAVVVNAPWHWAGTSGLAYGTRRVFDLTDDWRTMLPKRRQQIEAWYRRIEDEADEIVAVAPALQELFRREITVIPNAAAPELHASPPNPAPGTRRMVYVGTLSERFDADLISSVLRQLPDWSLDIYGQLLYSHGGVAAMDDLVTRSAGRVRLHGVVSRVSLASVIDAADVTVVPNAVAISAGQDSMKLYDYAARARPIVASGIPVSVDAPPVMIRAAGPDEFAAAVVRVAARDARANRTWSQQHTWVARSTAWLTAVLGDTAIASDPGAGETTCTS